MTQFPLQPPLIPPSANAAHLPPIPASLAYSPAADDPNPEPFILSPIVNLPPSFGTAYVGETFSCTVCASHDVPVATDDNGYGSSIGPALAGATKTIRDVRIKAEMKTPGAAAAITKLEMSPEDGGVDLLAPGATVQRIVSFDLKEEGNHVLAVTISYYEATDVSGRTRTFRKLYQFICKASLIVRTKPGPLASGRRGERRWVLEAQLENCGEDAMQLEKVMLELEPGLTYRDCNWEVSGSPKPLLHPGESEQVCFVVEETAAVGRKGGEGGLQEQDGRIVFGILGIGWRGEMGNRGFLSTGKLGTRHVKPRAA